MLEVLKKLCLNSDQEFANILLNSTINGILITDLEGNIKWVNKSFETNTGYSLEEVLDKNPRILKSGLTRKEEYEKMWQAILTKGFFEGSIYNKNKFGQIYKQNVKIWKIQNYFVAIIDYEKDREKIEKDIKAQFYLASKIQQKLLPPVPATNNFVIRYLYKSLQEIGGDIIEIIKIDESKIGIFVGDVSGHGIPAAMIQMMVKTIIKENRNYEDIENFLRLLNKKIIELETEMYLTCFFGIFDKKNMVLKYSLCGHPYPILIENKRACFLEQKNSNILGIFEEPNIIIRTFQLKKGQRFLIYTDGLTEAINIKKEEFKDYILGILNQIIIINQDIEVIISSIETFLKLHTTGQKIEDDYSILGIEII